MRAAVRQTRLKERLVRRSEAQASEGFNRQMQWRLKTIRLVLPKPKEPRDSGAFWFWRFGLGETDDSGSTKCDYESILIARAQRRRPEGVRVREASALEAIRLVLPNVKPSPSSKSATKAKSSFLSSTSMIAVLTIDTACLQQTKQQEQLRLPPN